MVKVGDVLRTARARWGLNLKTVEERSDILARQWGNPAYRVSLSWLDRVERENRQLSATKLIVLASIYGLTVDQLLALCPVPSEGLSALAFPKPNETLLLPYGPLGEQARQWLPEQMVTDPPPAYTMLVNTEQTTLPVQYVRGIIGERDNTLAPMVPSGSIVLIDTKKRAIANRKKWNNEFDRPIYFLLTREGYVSGFCELDDKAKWLTLVPHMLSYTTNKRWRYRKEIEVIGTVSAIFSKRVA